MLKIIYLHILSFKLNQQSVWLVHLFIQIVFHFTTKIIYQINSRFDISEEVNRKILQIVKEAWNLVQMFISIFWTFFWESHAHMLRDFWHQHFLVKSFFLQNPKYYIPLERYFCADSKEVLPYIKKIIPSKVTAILRPHDDVIIF